MTSSTTSNVYIHVIEDVINKVRQQLNTNGDPMDNVLSELQGTWEMRMMHAGAIVPPTNQSSTANSSTGGSMPATLPGTPLTDTSDSSLHNILTPNEYSSTNDNIVGLADVKTETRDFLSMSVTGKRKRDEFPNVGYNIPQQDGASSSNVGEDDEALNEDDDDDEYDDVDDEDELNTSDLVLAQFDKVSHTKRKWKCFLKGGIMNINNKNILFNKAIGEFDF